MLWKIRGKFQHQLVALLTLGIAIPITIVSSYSTISSTRALTDLASKQMQLQGESGAKVLNTVLEGVRADISYLKDTPPVQGIIRAKENRGIDPKDRSTYSAWTDRLNIIFTSVLKSKPYYYSLRFLDEAGNELVRLDRKGGKLRVLSASQLKNFKEDSYFRETVKIKEGEVYVSSIGLNRENGKLQAPYTPVIYYSTPIFNAAGNQRGIVVATLLSDPLFEIASDRQIESGIQQSFLVVNQEGYYLHHPNPEKEWGFDLNRKDERVQTDYPKKIADLILSEGKGFIQEGTDHFISYQTVFPNEDTKLNSIVLLYKTPKSVILAPINNFQSIAIAITIFSLIVVLIFAIQILQQVVNSATNLIGTISSFSNQVLSNMDDQERIATQQSSSVQQTTVTMDELNASSQKSSQQAESAATGARQALVRVEAGNKAVMAIMKEMTALKEKVEAIATQVLHLNQQTQQIITISAVVGDLANQTNMLALNASVEAVRAGEMGKGFSIVANEIRKLADESRKSGGKINDLVNEIQRAIQATVQVTSEGTQNVERGVKTAQSTAEVFVDITTAMEQVVENSQQIALNSKQQAVAVQQVTEAMTYLSRESADAAQGISQTKKGTEQLNEAAKELQTTI